MDRLNRKDFPAKHSKSARDDGWAWKRPPWGSLTCSIRCPTPYGLPLTRCR